MSAWIEDDEDGMIALLQREVPDASLDSTVLWADRIRSAADPMSMDRAEWKQAQQALARLRRHLAAAAVAEAAIPRWLRDCISYRKPVATTTEILAKAVNDLEGKIALGEAIVTSHFERVPPRRGNPSFAYSDAQITVARTAAAFWEEVAGKLVEKGRDADGLPISDFGRFLEVILDKLGMEGSPGLLAEKVMTPIEN